MVATTRVAVTSPWVLLIPGNFGRIREELNNMESLFMSYVERITDRVFERHMYEGWNQRQTSWVEESSCDTSPYGLREHDEVALWQMVGESRSG